MNMPNAIRMLYIEKLSELRAVRSMQMIEAASFPHMQERAQRATLEKLQEQAAATPVTLEQLRGTPEQRRQAGAPSPEVPIEMVAAKAAAVGINLVIEPPTEEAAA